MYPEIKLLIIGGCFPFQDNIGQDKLYHQILKKEIQESNNINLEIKLIRYNSIKGCFGKISESISIEKPDWVLFHLRVESILFSSKLFCKYYDKEGNIVKRINLSAFNLKYKRKDLNKTKNIDSKSDLKSEHFTRRIFRELNYFLGYVFGNGTNAMKDYLKLSTEIIHLCKTEGISLVISGPVSRPYSHLENQLSIKLYRFFVKHLSDHNLIPLNLLGMKDSDGNFLFCEDLKRVNETGHKRISMIIYNAFTKIKPD